MTWTFSEAFLQEVQCGRLTVSPASGAGYLPLTFSDTKSVALLKSTNTAGISSFIIKTTGIFSRSRFGTTSQHSTAKNGKALLTSYRAGFLAPTSVPPVRKKALPANKADSGKRCIGSFAKYDRSTSSWKMSGTYFTGDLTPSLRTFPPQGSMQNGVCYLPPPSEQNINATDYGFWRKDEMFPTPSTQGVGGSRGKQKFKRIFGIDSRQMNPQWLANIMGFPTDWTHYADSATPKFPSVRQWLLQFFTRH